MHYLKISSFAPEQSIDIYVEEIFYFANIFDCVGEVVVGIWHKE
jgi:hypothetical protein